MTLLIWSGPARRDVLGILEHYRAIDPDLADRIVDRVRTEPLALLEFPKIGSPTRRPGIRKWPGNPKGGVRGTPFLLFYAVRNDRVEIRRVVHQAMAWRPGE